MKNEMISQRRQIESAKNIKMENEIPSRFVHAKFTTFATLLRLCIARERNHNKMLAEKNGKKLQQFMISLLNYANLHSLAQIFIYTIVRWMHSGGFLPATAIKDYDQPASDRIAPAAATTKHSAY